MTKASNNISSDYVGRFAPSPTGPLHFGSLVAALASFLDARHQGGKWLVRMEDLDPPREQAGASSAILKSLESHQLFWDGEVLFQSQRHAAYQEILDQLQARQLVYPCYCTRKVLAAKGGIYPGTCRHRPRLKKPSALRLLTAELPDAERSLILQNRFADIFLGQVTCQESMGDFIVRRKDGLYAYQLAVVVDDIYQNITHVIRGIDLLDSTPSQIFLFNCLHVNPPQYGHVPVVLNELGQKLSKQHGAKALDNNRSVDNICKALLFLNHPPPTELTHADTNTVLQWAIAHWDRKKIPTHSTKVVPIN